MILTLIAAGMAAGILIFVHRREPFAWIGAIVGALVFVVVRALVR